MLSDAISELHSDAFHGCSNLTSIKIPKTVTHIVAPLFTDCYKLGAIEIDPANPVYDSANANVIIEKNSKKLISGCKNTIIPDYVAEIGEEAFAFAQDLKTISIPNNVTKIGRYAFLLCTSLENVIMNNSSKLEEIDEWAFQQCVNLKNIVIPTNINIIRNRAFYGCRNLQYNIKDNIPLRYLGNANNPYLVLVNDAPDAKLISCEIDNQCKIILNEAFCHSAKSLTNVVVPNSVKFISSSAFLGCDMLNGIHKNNGIYLGSDENKYLVFLKAKNFDITSCEIENNCRSIADSAFEKCSKLVEIKIPNSVNNIGIKSFHACEKLESISIPYGVTKISDDAFCGCNNLQTVILPESINYIGENSFEFCNNLKKY